MKKAISSRLETSFAEVSIYLLVYIPLGFLMDAMGRHFEIAWFNGRWQVLTCYGYLVLCSLWVRKESYFHQYLYGLFFLALLELPGYATGSSVIADNNYIDMAFTRANFSLVMVIFFAGYIPALNALCQSIYRRTRVGTISPG